MILPYAIASVLLALAFYSTSIIKELRRKEITPDILKFFWGGLFFDILGVILMSLIAGGISTSAHSVSGFVALALMVIKAIWSMMLYKKGGGKRVPVAYTALSWFFWLLVFLAGFSRVG